MKYRIRLICAFVCVSFFSYDKVLHGQELSVAGIDIEEPKPIASKGVGFAVYLDHKNWTYRVGEQAVFTVKLFKNGLPIDGVNISYTMGPEKMEPTSRGSVPVVGGEVQLPAETMKIPGFLRCNVRAIIDGKLHRAAATAAFDPENIKPTTAEPIDFDLFWSKAIKDSRSIPLNTKLTPIEAKSNDLVEVFQVEFELFNDGVKKGYGILSRPRKTGKYPAIIRFPGAGWVPSPGDQVRAAEGFITFHVYIHGKQMIHDRAYYVDLQKNELKDYQYKGLAHRDSFYYKKALLTCVRAVDVVYSLPDFDGENLGG